MLPPVGDMDAKALSNMDKFEELTEGWKFFRFMAEEPIRVPTLGMSMKGLRGVLVSVSVMVLVSYQ
jgi:hypothetical protein